LALVCCVRFKFHRVHGELLRDGQRISKNDVHVEVTELQPFVLVSCPRMVNINCPILNLYILSPSDYKRCLTLKIPAIFHSTVIFSRIIRNSSLRYVDQRYRPGRPRRGQGCEHAIMQ
ncbi:unnamed protein product, partial [Sphacelaria rigidula]